MFAITDVTDWPVRVIETDGADPKPWLCGPTADWMFKPAFTHPQSGNRRGEDWAEKMTDLADAALELAGHETRSWWSQQIQALTSYAVDEVVDNTSRLSDLAATFAKTVIATNRGRLLSG